MRWYSRVGYNQSHIQHARMEVRNTSEESEKTRAISKKLDEDAMLCNALWSDRRRLNTKTFLAFSRTSKRRNLSKLSTKKFFFYFGFIQREISFSGEEIFSFNSNA